MNEKELRAAVERLVLCELAKTGQRYVPVMSSNRHVHLCQADVEKLFGAGYQLTKMRDLVQPGQFACNERVTIETEKGKMALRVVGPARKETQIELSFTDAVKLGLKPPIRMSGDLEGSPGCTLANGDRARDGIPRGHRGRAHLHLAPDEAEAFGVKDGDVVSLVVEGRVPARWTASSCEAARDISWRRTSTRTRPTPAPSLTGSFAVSSERRTGPPCRIGGTYAHLRCPRPRRLPRPSGRRCWT